MKSDSRISSRPRTTGSRRRGFTFMEILFSVMILGIGFIMVAAMFPAALKQTQGNVEENEFNVLCRTAAQDMENLAYCTDPEWAMYIRANPPAAGSAVSQPPRLLDRLTGWVVNDLNAPLEFDVGTNVAQPLAGRAVPFTFHDPRIGVSGIYDLNGYSVVKNPNGSTAYASATNPTLVDALWSTVRGNMIVTDRRQNAWVALWSRSQRLVKNQRTAAASLNLFIFPVRSRSKPQYDPYATVQGNGPATANPACDLTYNPANLDPAFVTINYTPPSGPSINAPNGILKIDKLVDMQGNGRKPVAGNAANPVTEGCYVVVSDSLQHITATNPAKYNGMIFKVGQELTSSGSIGSSGGVNWSVAEIINIPAEQPFLITDPSKIGANDFGGQDIYGIVIGRQPDPADPIQHSDSNRRLKPFELLNRIGPAQELGYFPWSVVVAQ
jgi:type II secretory pathway pseudopilin PulG